MYIRASHLGAYDIHALVLRTTIHVPYYPAVTPPPPPFCDLLSGKKRGGGRIPGVTTRTCAFASRLSPPLPRICVLCSAVEDENSFDRHAVAVLKDGRVVGRTCCKTLQVARSQTPPTCRDGRMTASGNRPRSAKKAKTSSQTIFYMLDTQIQLFYTCNKRTRIYIHVQELQYRKPARAARGGGGGGERVMEVK